MPSVAPSGFRPLRDHPMREALINELHARPPEAVRAPLRAAHLAMLSGEAGGQADRAHLTALCDRFGVAPPGAEANHHSVDLGFARLKWERHTEFSSWTVFRAGCDPAAPFADPAISALPGDWVAALPGMCLVAVQLGLLDATDPVPDAARLAMLFGVESYSGGDLADGLASFWTDFRVHGDGWTRILVRQDGQQSGGMTPLQAGRMVQRLVEIETYRMLALLALPIARGVLPRLAAAEQAVAAATERAATAASDLASNRALLDQLTGLAAEVERINAETVYRFAATRAYSGLVRQRIQELRERRVEGLQPATEFLERRLAPAMATCEAVAARQETLATRIARGGNLLRTRVDVALEGQNADLLRSMDRRAQVQLLLQETVEGLSVVAISYYTVGLATYVLKGLHAAGLEFNVEAATAASVAAVVALVWYGMRRLRARLARNGH